MTERNSKGWQEEIQRKPAALLFPTLCKNEIPVGKLGVSSSAQIFMGTVKTKGSPRKTYAVDRSLEFLLSKHWSGK